MSDDGGFSSCRTSLVFAGLVFVLGCVSVGALFVFGLEAERHSSGNLASAQTRDRNEHVESLEADLRSLARMPSTLDAFESFNAGYDSHIPAHLRDLYVELNPHQDEGLALLSDPRDGSKYSAAHAEHHPWLREVAHLQGFADLKLIRFDGNVIYSVHKGRTFATRVSEGHDELDVRDAARVARETMEKGGGAVAMSSGHSSLLGEREFHAATPVVDADGRVAGALVVTRDAWEPIFSRASNINASVFGSFRERAMVVAGAYGLVGFLMLGGLVALVSRRRAPEAPAAPLPLVPVLESQRELESGGFGSHRSGTRPALSKDPEGLETRRGRTAGSG